MYERIRNIALVAVAACVLFCVIGTKVPEKLGVDFPEWTGVGLDKSSLEGRKYQSPPKPGIRSALSGKFQTRLEKYLADHVPMRDEVLLKNAALQRSCIAAANTPFRFNAYPTFYGSDKYYQPDTGIIHPRPFSKKGWSKKKLAKIAKRVSNIIESNDSIQWFFYLPDRLETASDTSVARLTSNKADYGWFSDNFLKKLPDNCGVSKRLCNNNDDYEQQYYLTDHHWKTARAYSAYCEIVDYFGRSPIQARLYQCFPGPFWGSNAREGLCSIGIGDTIDDLVYEQGAITVKVNGKTVDPTWLGGSGGQQKNSLQKDHTFEGGYNEYFHGNKGLVVIRNKNAQPGNILIVGDSFKNCIERLFATNYRTVHVIDPRYYSKETVREYIGSHDINDVVFLMSPFTLNREKARASLELE